MLWGLVAMMTLLLYGATVGDPDYVWGFASRDLLGAAGIGLVGLMISCLMAALMASKSTMMLTTSALLTRNVYAPMRPGKSDQHYVWAGRIFNVLYMIASVMAATSFKSVFEFNIKIHYDVQLDRRGHFSGSACCGGGPTGSERG